MESTIFVAESVKDVMIKIGENIHNNNSCVLILVMKECFACAKLLNILQKQDSSYMKLKYPFKRKQPHIFVIDINLLFDYINDASVRPKARKFIEEMIEIGTGLERGVRVPCTFRVVPNETKTEPVFSSNPIHGILSNSFISSLFKLSTSENLPAS